jgi:hypothetical protein
MALNSTCVYECRSGGNDLNGGGFDTSVGGGGVDYSQQNGPQITIDGATITFTLSNTTVGVLAGHTVTTADLGNFVRFTGGTVTAGRYRITAINTGTNSWTVDRAAGVATNTGTGRMGGAVKHLGTLTNSTGTTLSSGKIWVKNDGAYTLTTTTPGDGGPCSSVATSVIIEGYQTTRGDRGTPPTIDAGALTGFQFFAVGTNGLPTVINIIFDGNGNSTVDGIGGATQTRSLAYLVQVKRCVTGFLSFGMRFKRCYAESCTTGFTAGAMQSVAKSCGVGFTVSSQSNSYSNCIAYSCTSHGFSVAGGVEVDQCTSYGNGGDGFNINSSSGAHITNSISYGNTGYGFNNFSNTTPLKLFTNAGGSNTAGLNNNLTTIMPNEDQITLSADPFTNAASGDFSLNTAAGGGALLRAASLDVYSQTDAADIGAVQHADPATSGGGFYFAPL